MTMLIADSFVFGGNSRRPSRNLNDTWVLNGTSWTRLSPFGTIPPARANHKMTYDSRQQKVLLFGGQENQDFSASTWEWNGTRWSDVTPQPTNPDISAGFGMTYDPIRQRTIVLHQATTWEWDGSGWRDVTPSSGNPGTRHSPQMTFDHFLGQPLMFGGSDPAGSGTNYTDTWRWSSTAWVNVTPVGINPPSNVHDLVYDTANRRAIMFGTSSGTWQWNGSFWTQLVTQNIPTTTSFAHRMAYDSHRRRVVLSVADFDAPETWEFDGTNWINVVPNAELNPPGRAIHDLTYDSSRRKTVMFGGLRLSGTGGYMFDTWEYDGTRWTNVTPSTINPQGRLGPSLVYDTARQRVVLFGGSRADAASSLASNTTWELKPPTKPSMQFAVRIPSDIRRQNVTKLRVRAHCGGSSTDTTQLSGAELHGCVTGGVGNIPGHFSLLRSNTNNLNLSSATGLMDFETTGATAAIEAQNFWGPNNRMYFQCRPRATSGTGFAEVALGYMEVRIKYQSIP